MQWRGKGGLMMHWNNCLRQRGISKDAYKHFGSLVTTAEEVEWTMGWVSALWCCPAALSLIHDNWGFFRCITTVLHYWICKCFNLKPKGVESHIQTNLTQNLWSNPPIFSIKFHLFHETWDSIPTILPVLEPLGQTPFLAHDWQMSHSFLSTLQYLEELVIKSCSARLVFSGSLPWLMM